MLPKRYWFAWLKRRTLGGGKVRGTIDAATGKVHFYGKGKVKHGGKKTRSIRQATAVPA